MGIIAWLLVGLIAGWLAGMAMGGRGFGVLGNIVVGVVGALIAALSVRHVFALSPRFRATPEAVWFGGDWTIPWYEVKAVYESTRDVRKWGMSSQTYCISIEFHRVSTIFRTPAIHWLTAPFAMGSVDIAPDVIGDNATRIVAQLEAWRVARQHQRDAAS
jgi:uncharacterized membrane protein YeaQ/YmgE (transglycosylase-associated protein family)